MSKDAHFSSEFEAAEMHRRSHHEQWKERLASFALAIVIGMGLVAFYNWRRVIPDQLALGAAVQVKPAFWNGMPVNGRRVDDYPEVFPPKRYKPGDDLWVWLGNSQMHSINQLQEHDEVAVAHASRIMNFPVFGLSIPNASLRENLAVTGWAFSKAKPQWVIVPVVFYMFRMYDLRTGFHEIYDDAAKKSLAATSIGADMAKEIEKLGSEENRDAQGTSRLGFSLQTWSEEKLSALVSSHSQVWRDRDQAYAAVMNDLYTSRHWFMGIRSDTKRPMIPARLEANMQALSALIDLAKKNGARVLVYVAPIRWDVEPPYMLDQYFSWKKDLEAACARDGASFVDLDRLIPDNLWGTVSDQVDFMHFQGKGHEILANRVTQEIRKIEASGQAE
ncbi:MAG: hypothetical protein K2Y21_00780 [Phycisphaerales bacterium]|nr:hypothetical protein [Phycisphaerales bacterium]